MKPQSLFRSGEISEDMEKWLLRFDDCVDALNNIENLFENLNGQTILGKVKDFVAVSGNVYIGKNTIIHPNVTIEGPVIIGDNVEIRSHVLIRNNTYIGSDSVIGHGADIKKSLCLNGCKIQINTFTGDSIIGASARIGSGAIISNRKFNQSEVYYKDDEGNNKASGRGHMGAVLGRHSRIGANCVISPGTMIGEHTWIGSGCVVKGKIGDNKFVTVKQELEIADKDPVELKSGKGEWER